VTNVNDSEREWLLLSCAYVLAENGRFESTIWMYEQWDSLFGSVRKFEQPDLYNYALGNWSFAVLGRYLQWPEKTQETMSDRTQRYLLLLESKVPRTGHGADWALSKIEMYRREVADRWGAAEHGPLDSRLIRRMPPVRSDFDLRETYISFEEERKITALWAWFCARTGNVTKADNIIHSWNDRRGGHMRQENPSTYTEMLKFWHNIIYMNIANGALLDESENGHMLAVVRLSAIESSLRKVDDQHALLPLIREHRDEFKRLSQLAESQKTRRL